jgi:hypothetical protein
LRGTLTGFASILCLVHAIAGPVKNTVTGDLSHHKALTRRTSCIEGPPVDRCAQSAHFPGTSPE